MHNAGELVDQRIRRELVERVLPLIHVQRVALAVTAGPHPDAVAPFAVGRLWGEPWGTTWFRFHGSVPATWLTGFDPAQHRIEAVLDLGFDPDTRGLKVEAMVVEPGPVAQLQPRQGLHPWRAAYPLSPLAGPVDLLVEAVSTPAFPEFVPSRLGARASAARDAVGDDERCRVRVADLVLVAREAEELAHDIDVLEGHMLALPADHPRRARIRRCLELALDTLPDLAAARTHVATELDDRAQRAQRHRIVAVGHAHIDTAWLWPTSETRRKCTRTFSSVVAMMDDEPEFRFACSQAQQYAWIEAAHPDLFARIGAHVRAGRWIPVGGMWVEADMNLPAGESLVRQIVFGQRYFEERFGARCTEVWIPDVFGYPASLPQLFAAGGMNRFVTQKLSWNKQNRFPHHTFWWEGIDGTRVLTHFPPVDTYNAQLRPGEVARSIANFREHAWSRWSLMPFGFGDGGGGPTREMLARGRRLATLDPEWGVQFGTPGELFEAVAAEAAAGAPVPVWRGELYLETHRGTLTSQLATKLGNRRCERLLVEVELWSATLGRHADIDASWRDVLTQQFHDILPGSAIAWVHDDAVAVFERVATESERRIGVLLGELAPAGTSLANPSDVPVSGVIVVPDPAAEIPGADHALPGAQLLADGCIAGWAEVEPFALAPPTSAPDAVAPVVVDASAATMTNGLVTIRWDAQGTLVSIVDHEALGGTGRELVAAGGRAAAVELAPDHPVEYDAWDLEPWTRTAGTAVADDPSTDVACEVVDAGPLVGRVRATSRFGPSSVEVTHELRAGAREVGVHVSIDWHHDEHLLSMAFPLDVRTAQATCDIQFGVVERPTHPSSPWDAAKYEVCAHRFVDLSEHGHGVAVVNAGRYGHHVFGGAIRVSLARAATYPDPDADRGHHAVSLAVVPHDGELGAVRRAAVRLNRPPRLVIDGNAPRLRAPVVTVTDARGGGPVDGVEVDAVKLADAVGGAAPDPEGRDLIVRLHDHLGAHRRLAITFAQPIARAVATDLCEVPYPGGDLRVDGPDRVLVELRPFQLVTMRVTLR